MHWTHALNMSAIAKQGLVTVFSNEGCQIFVNKGCTANR